MARKKFWFSVKSLYVTKCVGKPVAADKSFVNGSVLYEERIVLLMARNHEQALKLAAAEAKKYSRVIFKNVYGQTVKTSFLGVLDSFELFEKPKPGIEVFSATEVLLKEIPKDAIIRQKFGRSLGTRERQMRKKFLNRDFISR